ncbi:hypothetical protein C499_08587 [Halogeometricum borinquense DSM 11551]|uniref:Uncharacterized protein n=1 Tax=Halogeometricum borinquense (strain ATCC 700274 / DSM 11551 / JCM 10706 / KCTC 4070 / PR3) TaxID=469382 RepID=E4NMH1_HALBP|nr:hypothetical protein Hbor_29300 [Halogeometricum borinquense DSM 11551]ELY27887.1 hypothetical protein C499_08587 [Halogeometricum borinquense DSM 11551]
MTGLFLVAFDSALGGERPLNQCVEIALVAADVMGHA